MSCPDLTLCLKSSVTQEEIAGALNITEEHPFIGRVKISFYNTPPLDYGHFDYGQYNELYNQDWNLFIDLCCVGSWDIFRFMTVFFLCSHELFWKNTSILGYADTGTVMFYYSNGVMKVAEEQFNLHPLASTLFDKCETAHFDPV